MPAAATPAHPPTARTVQATGRAGIGRRRLLLGAAGGLGALAVPGALPTAALAAGGAGHQPAECAHAWMSTVYDVVWPEGLTPPAAARAYAYTAIAMYEAGARTLGLRSLAGQVTGLGAMPGPPAGRIDVPCAMAASVAVVTDALFATAAPASRDRLTAELNRQLDARRAAGVNGGVVRASTTHGRRVGEALAAWIAKDGYAGVVGRAYTPPVGPDKWVPTPPNFGRAIEPYWSEVRPMVLRDPYEVAPLPHIPYSEEPGSDFHEQAMITYRASQVLTDEHRAIARFWTDNPLLSGLPSGHWMLAAQQFARQQQLGLATAVEAYARLGVALHDAFLNCWSWKYRYNLLRPVTYVQRHVDPAWKTFVNTPQFPEFTSGHSVASRAASSVLTDLLGTAPYVDDSHAPRGMAARSFRSFTHAADEAAQSRIYGGIHYSMGIELGKLQGDAVGALVIDRLRTRG